MISYVLVYDQLPESFFIHHSLGLERFSDLRFGCGKTYGAMLKSCPPPDGCGIYSLARRSPEQRPANVGAGQENIA
jgi:hypothetical protein